jgi:hypothetical protein
MLPDWVDGVLGRARIAVTPVRSAPGPPDRVQALIGASRPLDHFASASRFSFAQSLSDGTGSMGGPPFVPQAQGPSILASVMQGQDFVFKKAQT